MLEEKHALVVATVIGILVMIFIGVVLLGSVEDVSDSGDVQTFTVNDITVNRNCDVGENLEDFDVTVEYYNGESWSTLTETTDYTVGATSVTVLAAAMT